MPRSFSVFSSDNLARIAVVRADVPDYQTESSWA